MKLKKIGILLLSSTMMISSMGIAACADETPLPVSNDEVVEYNINDTASARTSKVIFDNKKITSAGVSWKQPLGYNAFRVWVHNTTNEVMTVKVTSAWGYHTEVNLPANTQKIVDINNDAHFVTYNVDFDTPTGSVSGYVSVRAADVDF